MTMEEKLCTSIPRLLVKDDRKSLIDNILNGTLFGFALVDLESPPDLVDKNFLFPPVNCEARHHQDFLRLFVMSNSSQIWFLVLLTVKNRHFF